MPNSAGTGAAMLPRERCDYSAIVDRPPLKLPGGARLVFWTIVNYEVWDIAQADGAAGAAGADRRRRCCPTCRTGAGTNTACGSAPGASSSCSRGSASARRSRSTRASARTIRASPRRPSAHGWEFMGHSYEQGPIHKEPDQAAMIERSLAMHRAIHRHAPGRLARTRPDADARDAGAARRRRHQIHRRLGLRRRADHDPHRQRPAGHAALFGRAQRHPDDDRAAPRERLSAQARDRPVRPALRRRARSAPRSWRSRSTPTSAASRTGSNTSRRSTTMSRRFDGRAALERRGDPRLVSVGAAR